MEQNSKEPIVSIICLAYNHAQYIKSTLDGFVMQKTDFPIEVLIHDDASTDETADIIREYEKKYPAIIKPIYQKENQYSKKVPIGVTYIYPKVKGKYIALCEGDDYWTDPLKLQKQVDFLESHPDYALVYTRTYLYIQEKEAIEQDTFGFEYQGYTSLLATNCIPTLTTCIRTSAMLQYIDDVKPQHKNWLMGDYPAWLWIAYHYKIKFMPDITSVYRILKESASHSQDLSKYENFVLSEIDMKKYYIQKFNQFSEEYLRKTSSTYFDLYERYIHLANYQKVKRYKALIDTNYISERQRKKMQISFLRYLKFWLKKQMKQTG